MIPIVDAPQEAHKGVSRVLEFIQNNDAETQGLYCSGDNRRVITYSILENEAESATKTIRIVDLTILEDGTNLLADCYCTVEQAEDSDPVLTVFYLQPKLNDVVLKYTGDGKVSTSGTIPDGYRPEFDNIDTLLNRMLFDRGQYSFKVCKQDEKATILQKQTLDKYRARFNNNFDRDSPPEPATAEGGTPTQFSPEPVTATGGLTHFPAKTNTANTTAASVTEVPLSSACRALTATLTTGGGGGAFCSVYFPLKSETELGHGTIIGISIIAAVVIAVLIFLATIKLHRCNTQGQVETAASAL